MESADHDDSPTLDSEAELQHSAAAWVPMLTIMAHPNLVRLGQKAGLHALMVRRPERLSRSQLSFVAQDGSSAPLLDVSVSRSPILFSVAADDAIVIDPNGIDVHVDNVATRRSITIPRQRAFSGVWIRLSSRVALMLRMQRDVSHAAPETRLLGDGPAMQNLRSAIERAAKAPTPVLILGESGSGKELVAEAIHQQSVRARGPWVAVNMATLNENTAYSHLFGHGKGSFTGAAAAHVGFFERAHHGSLFLDEVADANERVQAMLLRALETSRILPMGGERERDIDVRIIAATERNVAAETEQGTFRGSLAQRLAGIVIRVPPVRERREDIPRLLVHFLSSLDAGRCAEWFAADQARHDAHLSSDFMYKLVFHRFTGNVRELRNIAARLLAHGRVSPTMVSELEAEGLDTARHDGAPYEPRQWRATAPARRAPSEDVLRAALIESAWSPARAARLLGVPNSTLHYWIQQKGITRRASEYSALELQSVAQRCGGKLDEMCRELSVSPRGLQLRLRRLRIELSSSP